MQRVTKKKTKLWCIEINYATLLCDYVFYYNINISSLLWTEFKNKAQNKSFPYFFENTGRTMLYYDWKKCDKSFLKCTWYYISTKSFSITLLNWKMTWFPYQNNLNRFCFHRDFHVILFFNDKTFLFHYLINHETWVIP